MEYPVGGWIVGAMHLNAILTVAYGNPTFNIPQSQFGETSNTLVHLEELKVAHLHR